MRCRHRSAAHPRFRGGESLTPRHGAAPATGVRSRRDRVLRSWRPRGSAAACPRGAARRRTQRVERRVAFADSQSRSRWRTRHEPGYRPSVSPTLIQGAAGHEPRDRIAPTACNRTRRPGLALRAASPSHWEEQEMQTTVRAALAALALAGTALLPTAALAENLSFKADLNASSEVPPTDS